MIATPLSARPAFADLVNTATATVEVPNFGPLTTAPSTSTLVFEAPLPSITVSKTAVLNDLDGSGGPSVGDTVTFEISAENTGNVSITDVTLDDSFSQGAGALALDAGPALQSVDIDANTALGIDEVWMWSASYTLSQPVIDAGVDLLNIAEIAGFGGGIQVSGNAQVSMPMVGSASLLVSKTPVETGYSLPGETVSWTITATNTGNLTLGTLAVADPMATSITCASSSDATIASLAPGASEVCQAASTVTVADFAAGTIENTATVTAFRPDGTQLEASGTAALTALPIVIVAADDVLPEPYDPLLASDSIVNVFQGDTVTGVPATTDLVSVSTVGQWPDGVTLSPDGNVSIAEGLAVGVYTLTYSICQAGNPSNCDEANVTFTIAEPLATLSGVVFTDTDLDGVFNPLVDVGQSGYIITLLQDSLPVDGRQAVSGPDGAYAFEELPAGTYAVTFSDPQTGVVIGAIDEIVVGRGDVIVDQNLPIDPSGVVYDAVTGSPVPGATVSLVDANGAPLPQVCLMAGQQGQVTTASGAYRFDVLPGNAPQCPVVEAVYSIVIVQPSGYAPAPSSLIAPNAGALDATSCPVDVSSGPTCALSVSDVPSVSSPSPYFLSFRLSAGDPDVVMNHIPLDPLSTLQAVDVTIAKAALVTVIRRGEPAPWRISIRHSETTPIGPIDVVDTLPAGFTYVDGSLRVNGEAATAEVNERQIAVRGLIVNPNETATIALMTRAGARVAPGDHVNEAALLDPQSGAQIGAVARARVRIEAEPVFDCGDVIGTVFEDINRDGYRDDGEPGIAGVRLATVRGTLITTDQFGRYSLPCAELPDADIGSNTLIKLDERSLPAGLRLTTENPRVMRLTAGKISRLDFGVAAMPVLTINLQDEAFVPGTDQPSAALAASVGQWVDLMIDRGASLDLVYYARAGEKEQARQRLSVLSELINRSWRRTGQRGQPEVEIRIVGR